MSLKQINTIDEVIAVLEDIINDAEKNNDPLGYFAALYQKVTIKVAEGIANDFFDNGPRMEQLDVAFAKRYLDAFSSYQKNEPCAVSWKKAFDLSTHYWPIVLQHILMGINAHINLDLGIAAAEISHGKNLRDLENDFNKINEILSLLVHEVQDDLSMVWPALKYLLKWSGKADDFLVEFSMKLARDGAWEFARRIVNLPDKGLHLLIEERDQRVADKVKLIIKPGRFAAIILGIIRLTEQGFVSGKIRKLKKTAV